MRAKEAEVQRKLEEQKAQTSSSWRRGDARPEPKTERDKPEREESAWRSKGDPKEPEKKPEPWRPGQ